MGNCYIYLFLFLFVGLFHTSKSDYAVFECPTGWEDFAEYCYRFVRDPRKVREEAKQECAIDGAYPLTINTDQEHNFIVQQLDIKDSAQLKQNWWTSGTRVKTPPESLEFFWEGDGTKIESFFYWHNTSIPGDFSKNHIMYHYNGYNWGWILDNGQSVSPYICKISKEDIYKIQQEERGPDYGVEDPDQTKIEKGPKFLIQPQDTVYEPNLFSEYVEIICEADSYPAAGYKWNRTRGNQDIAINPADNARYTIINGKLMIHDPSQEEQDDGNYYCAAENKFGLIVSNMMTLGFGYLQDFPKSPRSPVNAVEYQSITIECNPPPHYPNILYSWYKDDIYNFVRPELKPYLMISHDGRLYFSEVTVDDEGQYFCFVYKPGEVAQHGKLSQPTELIVRKGNAGVYEPQVASGFPAWYPEAPKVGDTLRIECWATGTAAPAEKLFYSWDRVDDNGRSMPLPLQSVLRDHNRVIIIPDIKLYDAGTYRCMVRREHGNSNNKTAVITLQSRPYFILPLRDQFVDISTELRWRCEAGGEPSPTYFWLRNGIRMDNHTIPVEDRDRITVSNNVLTITDLQAKDNAMYQCAATNTHGTRYSTGELRVLSFAPSFAKYPLLANQFATEEGNTTLLCKPEAAPLPAYEDILWYKDNAPLAPGEEGSGSRLIKLPNGNLVITPVRSTDTGRYRCAVSNPFGGAETIGNLTVLSETTITMGPLDQSIIVNRTSFLHCLASYNPQLDVTYTWYHGDMEVEFDKIFRLGENRYEFWRHPHYRRGNGIYVGGIYIMNAQLEHAGKYTCIVESSSGRMIDDAQVFILGPPNEVAGVFHDAGTVTVSSVLVTWKKNEGMVDSYVIEGINEWEGFWKILHTNIQGDCNDQNTCKHNVTNLRPFSGYMLRMRAENRYGTSVPSVPTEEFSTYETKPDMYPEDVGGGGGKVGDLVITWTPLNPWEHNGLNIGYRVYWKNAGDDDWDGNKDIMGDVGRYVVLVGEQNFYSEYEVAVMAFNNQGEGPLSPAVTIRSAMGLPTATAQNVRAQPYNATACLVHWEPVSDSRDHIKGKLGGYRLSYWMECCEEEEGASRVTINGQAEEGLVIGLYPNTPYYFDVMVWNQAGNGPKSQYFIQRTLRNAPIDPPVEVQVEKRSDNAISVKWRGVSTTFREEPLEGYMVRVWRDGEHIKVAKDYDAAKETDLYIDDLRGDTMYKLRVFGYSRGGQGTMSSPAIRFQLGAGSRTTFSILTLCVTVLYTLLSTLR